MTQPLKASASSSRKEILHFSKKTFQRQVIILRGSPDWCEKYIDYFSADIENIATVSASTSIQTNFHNANPNQVVGKEFKLFVFHIDKNFDANLFSACMGTIVGDGVLIIPILDNPHSTKTLGPFVGRFIEQLSSNPHFHIFSKNNFNLSVKPKRKFQPDNTLYDQQKHAVGKIEQVVSGHRNRPLVLLANRGRGKSAALGIAAAKLIKEKISNIIITAPSFASTAVVFKHIKLNAPDYKQREKSLTINNASIDFIAPDKLLRTLPKTGLLLIDEAAAIPTPILNKLLRSYSRIIFSTTLHGYEGSGRGFELRFFKQLDAITPGWKKIELTQPIRWAAGDPLESFTNSTFLLNAEILDIEDKDNFSLSDCKIGLIPTTKLLNNEPLLSEIFALLTVAHYRTKPSDLVQLLTNPNSYVFISTYQKRVVATAFCLKEGGINKKLADEIYIGNRRPKGDLIPQTLIFHAGLKAAATLSCLRIVRVATHPFLQNKGIGTQLISSIIKRAEHDEFDYLGTSFGTTTKLINFWKKHSFNCVRVGFKKEASSNCHALMLLRPISASATVINKQAKTIFSDSFYHLLTDELRLLEPDIVHSLIYNFIDNDMKDISKYDAENLLNFANENRSYEDSLLSLIKFTVLLLGNVPPPREAVNIDKFDALIYKIFQKRDWQETSRLTNLKGKHSVVKHMKAIVARYLEMYTLVK